MKDTMDEVLKQEAELIWLVGRIQKHEDELIGVVKDMQDREKRVSNVLLKIIKRLNDLEIRIEKLEGRDDE